MKEQGPRRAIRIAAPLAAAILLASCVKPYVPPLEGELTARIKLQYVYYTGVRGGDTTLYVQMFIREGQENEFRDAYYQSLGLVSMTRNPKVPTHVTKIRSVGRKAIRMRLGFAWGGTEWMWTSDPLTGQSVSTQVPTSYEEGCSATQQFNPEPNKVYLASYTSLRVRCGPDCWLSPQCQVAIFLETPTGKGTFKLEPVGEPDPPALTGPD